MRIIYQAVTGYFLFVSGYWLLMPVSLKFIIGYWKIGCWMLDAGYWLLVAGHWLIDYCLFIIDYWVLEIWMLDTGDWLLDT